MNVVMVTGIFPPDIGGPATYVPTMARELVKRDHKVTVVTLSERLDHDDRSYSFSVHRIQRGLFKPLRFLLTVVRILREGRKAQLLYVNGLYLEAVIANYLLRKPMVQKIVGDWAWERSTNKGWVKDNFDDFQTRKHGLKVEMLKALRRFYARRAHKMIVASQYFARHVARWGVPEEKITVVSNAIEVPPSSSLRSSESIRVPLSTSFNVVTVSRLVPWKRVDELIEAIAHCEDAGLVIIGDGPERGRLEDLVQSHKLADRVYFAGSRNREETFSLMAACDLFVLNSSHETFSHVVLEAMSVGLPVVARAIGPIPDLVRDGENGVLIAGEDNGHLSESLRRLIGSPKERERLSYEGRETAKAYGCEAMVGKTEHILRGCAY
jgi:glycosyltransferase involved in cell wall biosynthesis